jgi:hypothetical protein
MEIQQGLAVMFQKPLSPSPKAKEFVAGHTGPLKLEIPFPASLAARCHHIL